MINHGGSPKILTRPGRYPTFPLRNWWARSWEGVRGLSDTVINFQGLTVVQVSQASPVFLQGTHPCSQITSLSQNQAAVVSDPQNHVFVIRNSAFVAFAIEGTYDVLSIVDQTHLPTPVKDLVTKSVLGYTHEVKMKSKLADGDTKEFVVATL